MFRRRIAVMCLVATCVATGLAGSEGAGEALRDAARTGDLARVQGLLDSGTPVEAASRHGMTALVEAAGEGHLDVVRLLLERGANVNARERFFGATALNAALEEPHFEIVRLLLERGATEAGEALFVAVERGDVATARVALGTGRVEPLELRAAQRALTDDSSAELRTLVGEARVERPTRKPTSVDAATLGRYAGRYRDEKGAEKTVAVREQALVLTGAGSAELVVVPMGNDRFETTAGDCEVRFGGRGGLIEWVRINRDGELQGLSAVTSDPQPMRESPGADAALATAPRMKDRPWPQFRGVNAAGNGDGQGAPATWNVASGTSIRFKTPIPGIALSSPIVWGERIFVTTAVGAAGDTTFRTGLYGDGSSVDDLSEHSFRLSALDARTGAVVWEREVHKGTPTVRRHLKSSLANATPATDGVRVVVLFGSVGQLAAYDFEGQRLWQQDVGVLDCNDPQSGGAEWGHASSPILHGDRVILQADRRHDSFLAAYALADGTPLWRVAREEPSTWSTPSLLAGPGGAAELVTNGQTIRAYDPADGALLWTLGPNSEVVVATPVVGAGVAYLTAGYPPIRPIYAVRGGSRGDLRLADGASKSEAIAWSHARGGTYIPTPILYRDLLYTLNNNGILSAYDAASGDQVYQTRVGAGGSSFSASPVAADGRLYIASESGEVYVLRAGREYGLLATNAMDEVVMATPAVSAGLLVVRTLGHVVGIGEAQAAH